MVLRGLLFLSLVIPAFASADTAKQLDQVDTKADARAPLPVDDFFRHSEFDDIKISPTGEYLAASVKLAADTGALVVLKRSDLSRVGAFRLAGRSFVTRFDWASPTRIVFSIGESAGSKTNPAPTGEVLAMDFDGKNEIVLMGPRATRRGGSIEGGTVLDTLVNDDDHVLVQVFGIGAAPGMDFPKLERLNIRTGARKLIARAPIANASFLADQRQRARLAWAVDKDWQQKVYYREPAGGEWRVIHDEAITGVEWTPRFVYPDGASALIEISAANGPNGLYRHEFASGKSTRVARDDAVDPWFVGYALDRSGPVAVAFMAEGPKLSFIDREAPEAKAWASVLRALPGKFAVPTSRTTDGRNTVFQVFSDREPGRYYLYDNNDEKLTFLLASREWIDPERMGPMEGFRITARDGKTLHGYVTFPPDAGDEPLPLIINPHGGPIGPFDTWGWNSETQFFASRGYATLQVNFRGSGNYGRSFRRAGYQQWGSGMIDDMTDAVRWAVEQGIADPDRICIYGASYGAYASAMSVVREQSLYRCAVGYVGVYDLPLMYRLGDIPDLMGGVTYLSQILGRGDVLAGISPALRADEIKVPMFLIAGNEDQRTPPEQSRRFRDALTEAGNPPKWMDRDFEGHGFFKLENNRALYTDMAAFFDEHIGAGRKAKPEPIAATGVSSH
jgi:dipeptidyl aminopeptidase/acylaminoacyl peptidase